MQTHAGAIGTVTWSPWFPPSFSGLVLDATERCVDIRIMRLEPISERPPQHARSGARRATLHHIVLAVKEVCGVARIEGHGRKSWKWRKLRPRPLPPVPHEIVYAKSTRPGGMCSHWQGDPRFEIEIPPGRARRFFAPRIAALPHALRRSIRRAMKLRFGRQFASQPFRIRSGFGVAHVDRPLQRQSYLAKHRPVVPEVAFAPPEHGMLNTFLCLPVPGLLTPKGSVLVAPRLHEPQKIVIRYVVILDGEFIDGDFVRPKFVVPPEFIAMNAFQSQDRRSPRTINHIPLHPVPLYPPNHPPP